MATVEHAALVLLVSLTLGAAGALADAERLPRAVHAQIRRAFCLVAGGDCLARGGPRPCVLRSTAHDRERRVSAFVVRLEDGREVLQEERSDGTVRVTVADSGGLGAAVVVGGQVRIGGRGVRVSAEAGGDAAVASGRTFVVRDAAAARALLARLGEERLPAVRAGRGALDLANGRFGDEQERFVELRTDADLDVALSAPGLRAGADLVRGLAGAVRVERRTGERTLVLHTDRDLDAELGAPFVRLGAGGEADTALELTLDRHGTPVTLTLHRTQAVRGEAKVGPFATAGGGDRLELEARLDLADPEARASTEELLRAARGADAGRALHAARALGARLAGGARLDARLYATTHDERTKGATIAFVGRAGYEVVTTTDTARLIAAAGREPGLGWAKRLDCVAAAAA